MQTSTGNEEYLTAGLTRSGRPHTSLARSAGGYSLAASGMPLLIRW